MVYNDFSLPGQKEFEELAREYSKEIGLKNKPTPKLLDDICYSLKYLEWLYEYINKKLRIKKLKDIFLKLSNNCKDSFIDISNNYEVDKNYNLNNKKRLNNFNFCLKIAIYTEAELIENLFNLDDKFLHSIINHINNIKILASL